MAAPAMYMGDRIVSPKKSNSSFVVQAKISFAANFEVGVTLILQETVTSDGLPEGQKWFVTFDTL